MKQEKDNKEKRFRFREERERTEEEKRLLLKRKRIIAIVSAVVAVVLLFGLAYVVSKALMFSAKSDEGLAGAATNFKNIIDSYGKKRYIVALGIQILQMVVSPIPGEVVETGMGLCFGWFWGAVICLVGSAIASAMIMAFVKKFGIRAVELFVSVDKINDLKFINNEKKLERLVFLLYLVPGTPKDPLIFFFGLTKISTWDFVIIQTIARIPTIVSSTIGGKFILDQNYVGAIWIYAITGVLAVLGMVFYNKIVKKLNAHRQQKKLDKLSQKHSSDE